MVSIVCNDRKSVSPHFKTIFKIERHLNHLNNTELDYYAIAPFPELQITNASLVCITINPKKKSTK